jgi:hypothetical protein
MSRMLLDDEEDESGEGVLSSFTAYDSPVPIPEGPACDLLQRQQLSLAS